MLELTSAKKLSSYVTKYLNYLENEKITNMEKLEVACSEIEEMRERIINILKISVIYYAEKDIKEESICNDLIFADISDEFVFLRIGKNNCIKMLFKKREGTFVFDDRNLVLWVTVNNHQIFFRNKDDIKKSCKNDIKLLKKICFDIDDLYNNIDTIEKQLIDLVLKNEKMSKVLNGEI